MAIKHYDGKLGVFDYNDEDFELVHYDIDEDTFEYLYYCGSETDGVKIKIPDGIKSCDSMFGGCDLINPPVIPESVKDCNSMFLRCKSLKEPPVIPESVIDCEGMFDGCQSLKEAPVIPEGVEYCVDMFENCKEEIQKAGEWNINHRGESYYEAVLSKNRRLPDIEETVDVEAEEQFD